MTSQLVWSPAIGLASERQWVGRATRRGDSVSAVELGGEVRVHAEGVWLAVPTTFVRNFFKQVSPQEEEFWLSFVYGNLQISHSLTLMTYSILPCVIVAIGYSSKLLLSVWFIFRTQSKWCYSLFILHVFASTPARWIAKHLTHC